MPNETKRNETKRRDVCCALSLTSLIVAARQKEQKLCAKMEKDAGGGSRGNKRKGRLKDVCAGRRQAGRQAGKRGNATRCAALLLVLLLLLRVVVADVRR